MISSEYRAATPSRSDCLFAAEIPMTEEWVVQERGLSIVARGEKGGGMKLVFSGRAALDNVSFLLSSIRTFLREMSPSSLIVDLSGVEYIDSSGALVFLRLEEGKAGGRIPVTLLNMTDEMKDMIGLLDMEAINTAPIISERRRANIIEQVGDAVQRILSDIHGVLDFLGELLGALCHSLRHPMSIRWEEVLFYMRKAGADGLPIVGLISMLLGFVVALMAVLQLLQFGGNRLVASVAAIAMVREFGPIMTAILVAGRSGSAFAAEIGTMVVNEEVDALVVMGFDRTRFLVVPKVIACAIAVPLLTLYADLFGILGGLLVGLAAADLTVYEYFHQIPVSITLLDVGASAAKALFFAVLIAGIGCQRGFLARGGPESVGALTTSAVVSAIFLIIVADTAFALVLHYVT